MRKSIGAKVARPVTELTLSQRLARQFRDQIQQGQWEVGTRLPSLRQMAEQHKVSVDTAKGALRELEMENLIECQPRRRGVVKAGLGMRDPHDSHVGVLREVDEGDTAQESPWGYRIAHAAEQLLLNTGYRVMIFPKAMVGAGSDQRRKVMLKLGEMGKGLAGVVCYARSGHGVEQMLAELDSRHIPWVTINRLHEQSVRNFVTAANRDGGRAVGRCFARLGYERVLLVNSVRGGGISLSETEKLSGFLEGYLHLGQPIRGINHVDLKGQCSDTAGYEATMSYLAENDPPQGIFAAVGDYVALGAIRACRERGLSVPQDVGVVGATGLAMTSHTDPPLTVLEQPMEQMGRQAAQILLEMIREDISWMPGRYVRSRLILRESLSVPEDIRLEIERENGREHG